MPRLNGFLSLALPLLLLSVTAICVGIQFPQPTRAEATLVLNASAARVGADVSVTGTGFLPVDSTCKLSSPSSPALIFSSACVARDGLLSGSFTIGNVMPGAYVVQASGNTGDFAQAVLDVSGGAQLQLNPSSAAPGIDVSIQGSGFLPADNTCTISSPSSPNPVFPGSDACVIQSGLATGSFMIGNVPPGDYVIQVTGNEGDSVQAVLNVG